LAPGNVLDGHAVLGAFHSSRLVEEVANDSPQRDEKPAPLWLLVIARRRFQTGGAFTANPAVRHDLHLHAQGTARASDTDALENESHKVLNPVQKRLNFQLGGWFFFHTRFNPESVK
jgi:hypothetical protein